MRDVPYSRFDNDELILRDKLAIERTLLANERTLLAYLRSGVGLLIAGVSIMQFSEQSWFWAVGLLCVPIGIVAGVIGVARYRRMNEAISLVRKRSVTEARKASEDAGS
jgi:putative membrane protein